jgi:hypothetical protein
LLLFYSPVLCLESHYKTGLGALYSLSVQTWKRRSGKAGIIKRKTIGQSIHLQFLWASWSVYLPSLLKVVPLRDSFGFFITHCEFFKKNYFSASP